MIKPFLKPFFPIQNLRRFCTIPSPEPQISETLNLLQTLNPESWPTNPTLQTLISTLPPPSILKLTRKLPNYQNALQFFTQITKTPLSPLHLSLSFQALLEHAKKDTPSPSSTLFDLFLSSKTQNIPLSINSANLLIKCFAQAKMLDEMIMVYDSLDVEVTNTDVLNLILSGLLRWGKFDNALKVLDEMLEPDTSYPPNANTTGIVFSYIFKRDWCGRSVTDEEIFRLVTGFGGHSVYPCGTWFTNIITRFCRNGECGKAWDVLRGAMEAGWDVEVECCNAMLTGLGKERDFGRMNLLMKEMKEKGVKPNVVTFGIMIKHLCSFRRVDEGLEVLEKMGDEGVGVEPDVIIYNTLIDGLCKVGRQDEGLKLMEKMRLSSKCKPNTVTYNCLIDGFCKVGEIDKGCELFEEMGQEGVEVNVVTLNTLVGGMCRNGRVSSAMSFFNSMREKGLKGNTVTYTVLITAFCNANNIDKAMRLFDEMRESGCSPDAVLYYCLISGLSLAGRTDDAMFVVSKLKEAGFVLDVLSYNILISGFCRRNKFDKAIELLKDMETDGVKPDCVTCNTLISHYCSNGNFKHAHTVMKKMIERGLTPTIVTYGTLIQAYCSNDNIDAAMKLFRDMNSSSKVPPNTVIYNILVGSLCKIDDVEAAISLMDDMKEKGVKANTTTYNALLKGLQHRNWFEKALEVMDRMTEEACHPDYRTMEVLTEWLSEVGEIEKLRKFVQSFQFSASTA